MKYKRYHTSLDILSNNSAIRELRQITHTEGKILCNNNIFFNFSSNDYLGIAAEAELWKDFIRNYKAVSSDGGSCSSRLLTGNCEAYTELETLLAEMFNRECALVFNSGYHANMGILPALSSKQDLILSDKMNHASIIDGIKLCNAKHIRYKHLDYAHLENLLQTHRDEYEQVFIVTESIFSMDGDIADLRTLCNIKEKYNAFLYVDEAHAIGTRGQKGLGCVEEQDCINRVDFIVGTFGKAIASQGAYLIADKVVCEYLVNTMRTLIFTTALPPISLKWTIFVMKKIASMYEKRYYLQKISSELRDIIAQTNYKTLGESNIIPAIVGENDATVQLALKMQNEGVFVLPIRHPTVPTGTARLRFSLTANMSKYEIDKIENVLL